MFFIVLKSLITLLICMAIGFGCYKRKIVSDDIISGMSGLLVKVILPCLVIHSMQKPLPMSSAAIILASSALVFFFGALVGLACTRLLRARNSEKGVWMFALTLPNIVYMGFPVIGAALGEDSLFYVSIANISFNSIAFSLGIRLITLGYTESGPNLRGLLTNNAIIALIFGMLLFIFSIKLPAPVNDALSMIGGMTTPISMIIIGGMLARDGVGSAFKDARLILIILVRLIVIPVFVMLSFRLVVADEMILNVLVLMSAMPAASVTAIFAERYGGNTLYASKMVFVSTVISVFTIPVISLLL